MNDEPRSTPPSKPDAAESRRPLPWFTADEFPPPPPEMRRPPKEHEPTLFDDVEKE
jgi:hypothetical protein